MAVPVTQSAEWTEHEHVSEHVQLEAQKLVDLVGSSELSHPHRRTGGRNPARGSGPPGLGMRNQCAHPGNGDHDLVERGIQSR